MLFITSTKTNYRIPAAVKRILRAFMVVFIFGAAFTVLFSASAQGAPVQGTIDFGGVVTFDTMSLATAARVNTWNSAFVLQDSGNFSGIAPGTNSTMAAPWIFNPSTATPALWNVGGFTFDLSSSTIVSQSSTFLDIRGVGTITGNGFDPTPGTWSFSASRGDGGTASNFGFQAQAAAIPEASTVAFLVFGVLLVVTRRALRRKAA